MTPMFPSCRKQSSDFQRKFLHYGNINLKFAKEYKRIKKINKYRGNLKDQT